MKDNLIDLLERSIRRLSHRADLRGAIRRLMAAAAREPAVVVPVRRDDVQLLLAIVSTRLDETPTARAVAAPDLNPNQV